MKNAIKTYIDEQCLTDTALREKYREDMLGNIIDYVTEQAKKLLNAHNGGIDSDTVYKWVRHYILDVEGEVDNSEAIVIQSDRNEKTPANAKVDVEAIKKAAAEEAVNAYKEAERKKAEEARKAKEEAAARKAAEKAAAENFVNPNQIDLFGAV